MVNLLFISNSTKIDVIKNALQPFLKVKIDIVGDFDYGLKDVFEKRPATVFIQDQIAGVTGESVARHIQMLLGASAPLFIFMYEGSTRANPIKGLFDYLIDLSQTEQKIVADIQATLKSSLGVSQWEKIYIPPNTDRMEQRDSVVIPEGMRIVSDKLVDDFLTNLDNSGPESAEKIFQSTDIFGPLSQVDDSFQVVSSHHDQLAQIISETSMDCNKIDTSSESASEDATIKMSIEASGKNISHQKKHAAPECSDVEETIELPAEQSGISQRVTSPSSPLNLKTLDCGTGILTQQSMSKNPPIQQSLPADFIINGDRRSEDVVQEDLLRVFEENYYSHTGGWKRYVTIAVVLLVCAGGAIWYLLKQNSQLLTIQSKPSAPTVAAAPVTRSIEPATEVQHPVLSSKLKDEAEALPTFIPLAGLDSSYSSLKPGWVRYVDTDLEYRVFRSAGKIKALQVLGVNNRDISEPKLKTILIELLGDSEYHVKSREQKQGYFISRASVGQKAELLIYRRKSTLRAFVVSLD